METLKPSSASTYIYIRHIFPFAIPLASFSLVVFDVADAFNVFGAAFKLIILLP